LKLPPGGSPDIFQDLLGPIDGLLDIHTPILAQNLLLKTATKWKMPDTENIVINTGPIIALVAALGELKVLSSLYRKVLVPFEVIAELHAGGPKGFAVGEFEDAIWLSEKVINFALKQAGE
jgi:hypothetical protein